MYPFMRKTFKSAESALPEQERPLGFIDRGASLLRDAVRDSINLRQGRIIPLLLLLMATIAFGSFLTPSVSVFADGEYFGVVSSEAEFTGVAELVETQVSGILGREYNIDSEFTCKFSLVRRGGTLSKSEVRSMLLKDVEEITNLYTLSAGGEILGASNSPNLLDAIVKQLEYQYTSEGGSPGLVLEPYTIAYRSIPSDTPTNIADILKAADSALTVSSQLKSSYTVSIPFDTVMIFDDSLYVGETEVVSEGILGELQVSLDVSCEDGVPVERNVTGSEVIAEPVSKVVSIGTQQRPPTASYGSFIWPTGGTFSSGFGPRSGGVHKGIDICNSLDTEIIAADGGEVTYAGDGLDGFGNLIIITHDNGTQTYYAHLNEILVSEGTLVARGQEIGKMGTTGRSSGIHLHFEVHIDGTAVDPMEYLP